MKKNLFFSLLVLLGCSVTKVMAQPGDRITISTMDMATLSKNKSAIQHNDPRLMPAYQHLIKDAEEAMQFAPVSVMEKKNNPPSGDKHDYMSLAPYFWPDPSKADGLPYIRKDGQTNPEVKDYKDKDYMPKLCEYVHTLSLAYYFSGQEKYAAHAAKLLRVWFLDEATKMNPNLNYGQAIKGVNDGRGAGLIDVRHFIKVIDGIGLLNGSKSWTSGDDDGMKQWFNAFMNWMETSKVGTDELKAKNNHGDWYDGVRLSISLYTGNETHAKEIVLNVQKRIDSQEDDAGMFPLEMERTTSLHYSGFALEAFFHLAQMAEKTGIDLWNYTSPSGKSLKKAFDALSPYLSREKVWTGQQINPYDFEEAIPMLAVGAKHYGCTTCIAAIKSIAGDKADQLTIQLLTDLDY